MKGYQLHEITKKLKLTKKLKKSNYDSDAKDNIDSKMNLYFTYESRDTLKPFSFSNSKLNIETKFVFSRGRQRNVL